MRRDLGALHHVPALATSCGKPLSLPRLVATAPGGVPFGTA